MSKRYIRRVWQKLRPINTWYFFAAFLVFLVIGIFAVRQNNLTSIKLRDEVLKADQADGDVEAALQKLREHMYSHMNASLSTGTLRQPIQLKYRYERLLEAEQKKTTGDNKSIYDEAQAYCESQFPAGTLRDARVPCVQQYLTDHGSGGQATNDIPEDLYKFDFVSPRWSPDLAGWSLLFSGVFLALFLIRYLTERWFKSQLKDTL